MLGHPSSGEGLVEKGKRKEEKEEARIFFSQKNQIKPNSGRAEIAQPMRKLCIPLELWAGIMGLLVAWM